MLDLKEKVESQRAYQERVSAEGLQILRDDLMRELITRDELIQSAQEDMQLSRKKLAKERSDFQVQFNELKASINEVFSSYEA